MVPLLKFYFHEEVRRAAVSGILSVIVSFSIVFKYCWVNIEYFWRELFFLAMPELLRSAKLAVEKGLAQGRNESYIKQLSDYIVPAFVEALTKVLFVVESSILWYCNIIPVTILFWIGNWNTSIALLQEPDTEICASMLDALNECIQVVNFCSVAYSNNYLLIMDSI